LATYLFITKSEPVKLERAVKYYEKGDKPLEFIPSCQWFVKILDKKEELLQKGEQIIWEPHFAKIRFDDWTKNLALDWNISRQRYFGVPILAFFNYVGFFTISSNKRKSLYTNGFLSLECLFIACLTASAVNK